MAVAFKFDEAVGEDDGRARAFTRLYAETWEPLLAYCRRLLPAEAEELAQESMARAWASWERYSADRPFWAWVVTIARRLAVDEYRRASRGRRYRHAELRLVGAQGPTPDEALERAEEHAFALEALTQLRARHQQVLNQRDVAGWSYEEIAAFEGVTVDAARHSVKRARAALRAAYAKLASGTPAAFV